MREIRHPLGLKLLLVAVHFPSKLHRSSVSQTLFAARLSRAICAAEDRVGHANSLVIGDLNMDPFEDGVTAADCFHGVMDKQIVRENGRMVDGQKKFYFYNPMWNFLGDERTGPPGTYYHRGGQVSQFWHIFDQVLLRPSLLPHYSPSAIQILTSIGGRDLLREGRIDTSVSDHLPILLKLKPI
jgi:hypothetical protein